MARSRRAQTEPLAWPPGVINVEANRRELEAEILGHRNAAIGAVYTHSLIADRGPRALAPRWLPGGPIKTREIHTSKREIRARGEIFRRCLQRSAARKISAQSRLHLGHISVGDLGSFAEVSRIFQKRLLNSLILCRLFFCLVRRDAQDPLIPLHARYMRLCTCCTRLTCAAQACIRPSYARKGGAWPSKYA